MPASVPRTRSASYNARSVPVAPKFCRPTPARLSDLDPGDGSVGVGFCVSRFPRVRCAWAPPSWWLLGCSACPPAMPACSSALWARRFAGFGLLLFCASLRRNRVMTRTNSGTEHREPALLLACRQRSTKAQAHLESFQDRREARQSHRLPTYRKRDGLTIDFRH